VSGPRAPRRRRAGRAWPAWSAGLRGAPLVLIPRDGPVAPSRGAPRAPGPGHRPLEALLAPLLLPDRGCDRRGGRRRQGAERVRRPGRRGPALDSRHHDRAFHVGVDPQHDHGPGRRRVAQRLPQEGGEVGGRKVVLPFHERVAYHAPALPYPRRAGDCEPLDPESRDACRGGGLQAEARGRLCRSGHQTPRRPMLRPQHRSHGFSPPARWAVTGSSVPLGETPRASPPSTRGGNQGQVDGSGRRPKGPPPPVTHRIARGRRDDLTGRGVCGAGRGERSE